jgi:hypothetical protein
VWIKNEKRQFSNCHVGLMYMDFSKKIVEHILKNEEFLAGLNDNFDKNLKAIIIDCLSNSNKEHASLMDKFEDWFREELREGVEVLLIGWESAGWGPGGSGAVWFNSRFGIVSFFSSDYDDDHIEVFDKDNFEPWCIEHLCNDYVELSSAVYNEEELIEFANNLGMDEETELTVNGKEVEVD